MQRTLQRLSSALMVPVITLPIASLFLALGVQLGLAPLVAAGNAIIRDFLPLLFAVGVSLGFTRYDGMAGFAGVVGYVVMRAVMLSINAELDMSVLGGIVSGAITATLFFRYSEINLPEYLGFFSGKRFVPMATAVANLFAGVVLGFIWYPVQVAIFAFGNWIMASDALGLFFYGLTNRLLIPTGLHHIIQNLLLFTFGTFENPVTGAVYQGEVQRFFAGDPTAGNFSAGFFVVMMFCIPALCLAMVHESHHTARKRTAGVLITAALTSLITGITEPAEFTFMFAAPVLFLGHAFMTGTATLVSHLLGIRHFGFALPMYIINWRFSENAWLILPLGVVYASIYYFGARWAIRRFNLPTLGRTPEDRSTTGKTSVGDLPILVALGGPSNLVAIDACMTRLRLEVRDMSKINESEILGLGAAGIKRIGANYLHVVMGTKSQLIAEQLRQQVGASVNAAVPILVSPITGAVLPLNQVPDDVFSQGLMGEGIALVPDTAHSDVVSPCRGIVERVFPGGHAVVISHTAGSKLLIHIGLDTVHLKGRGFTALVAEGAEVFPGEVLVRVDWAVIGENNYNPLTVVVCLENSPWAFVGPGAVVAGEDIIARG